MVDVSIIALVVSVAALGVSVLSVRYTRQKAHAAEREANAAHAAELRARTPDLVVFVAAKVPHDSDTAIYSVRNDGPQDLDSVVVYRPEVIGGVRHPVAATGVTDWQDSVELGPVNIAETRSFTLSLGVGQTLPDFSVRVRCAVGEDHWILTMHLENPRNPPPPPPPRIVKARLG